MAHSRHRVQASSPEGQHLEARLPRYSSRPLYMAIRAAFIERFALYYAVATKSVSESVKKQFSRHPERLSKDAEEMVRLDEECSKLATMLFPGIRDAPLVLRARHWDEQMGPRDWRDPAIVKFLRRVLRRWRPPRGRPATLQPVGLRALELRLIDRKRWSWNALPEELCTCGADPHGFQCRENIRREVLQVREMLRNLGVSVPPAK